jgi:hypothetical protein
VLAALEVVVLADAAFFIGSTLRTDTSASVAPSPLGSCLTANRGSMGSAAGRSVSAALFTADYASLGIPAAAGEVSKSCRRLKR